MKFSKMILFLISLVLSPVGFTHGHGGGHFGGHHGGGGSWGFGYGLGYGPFGGYGLYGGYGGIGRYGYAYPYAYPPVVTVPTTPPVYVQRNPVVLEANYWYYCRNPNGYYPYVRECPGGWEKVAPQPAQ